MKKVVIFIFVLMLNAGLLAQGIIIDHSCTDIAVIPESAIMAAKSELKIAYGHTSHGSQITDGMSGLVSFANNGGLGLDLPDNIFAWNSSGSGGALKLHDYAMGGDVGYWPDWYNNTISYLNNPANSDVNVIIWSWCGQASTRTQQSMLDTYLLPMTQLESMYPNVTFVYMTGHADGSGLEGNLHIRNQQIRQYCIDNNKVLFDFYDIECYDPDGNYYGDKFVTDACNYNVTGGGTANWATQWQASHTQGVDWYNCSSAHSQPLNANRKAYAAWWLWATLAGWSQNQNQLNAPTGLTATQQGESFAIDLSWSYEHNEIHLDNFIIQRRVDDGSWQNNYATVSFETQSYVDSDLSAGNYSYRIVAYSSDDGSGSEAYSAASNIATVTLIEDVTIPSAPDGLEVGYNGSSVVITWNDNADNEQYYSLERQTDDGEFVVIAAELAADSSNYNDSGIETSHSYTYRVRAGNIAGLSDYSNSSSVWIPAGISSLVLQTASEVDDAFIFAASPNTNYGSTNYTSTIDRYICRFNLPEALQGKLILSAELEFYGWSLDNYQPDMYMQLYRISDNWTESGVTWNSSQAGVFWQMPGGDHDPEQIGEILITNTDHAYYPALDIASLLQEWVDGRLDNNGILLVDESGSGTGLKASEYSNNARTRLRITYTDFDCSLNSDLVVDHRIDLLDFAALAGLWLSSDSENDLAGDDDYIDIADLTILAQEWLTDCRQGQN